MSNLRQKLIKLGQYLVEISLSVCNLRGKFISIFQGRHFWFTNYKIFVPQAQVAGGLRNKFLLNTHALRI